MAADNSQRSMTDESLIGPGRIEGNVIELDAFRKGTPSSAIPLAGPASAPWQIEAVRKITAFAQYKDGWDTYSAKRLKPEAGIFALKILSDTMAFDPPMPAIVPTLSGGVQLEWHRNARDIEVEINGTYDVTVWCYDHQTDTEETFDLSSGDITPLAIKLALISSPH